MKRLFPMRTSLSGHQRKHTVLQIGGLHEPLNTCAVSACCWTARDLEKAAALVRKVSATISRRDALRKYMDVIEAMLARSGALHWPGVPSPNCQE